MADDSPQHPPAETTDRVAESQDSVERPTDASEAEETLRRAEAGLEEAKRLYRRARRQVVRRLRKVRQTTAGDLVDHTLKLVKRYPGPSVAAALFLGFLAGRSSRR